MTARTVPPIPGNPPVVIAVPVDETDNNTGSKKHSRVIRISLIIFSILMSACMYHDARLISRYERITTVNNGNKSTIWKNVSVMSGKTVLNLPPLDRKPTTSEFNKLMAFNALCTQSIMLVGILTISTLAIYIYATCINDLYQRIITTGLLVDSVNYL
ncbi:hypothetical protein N9N03_02810 [Chlamydiia bacterium]|nr:hypothetical protein [Chlamydiia bacterium]